jgi:hypothetical protein
MTYATKSNVVAFSDAKQAALYFDYVIPARIHDLLDESREITQVANILQNILPPSLINSADRQFLHGAILDYLAQYAIAFPRLVGVTSLPTGETPDSRLHTRMPQLRDALVQILKSVSEPIKSVLGLDLFADAADETDDISLQLAGLSLVNVDHVRWEQLLEFRKDADSLRRLQNLRLFFHEKFDGKPQAYVRDALLLAIEKHDDTVKKWGFETVSAGLECIFSSKSLAALGAGIISVAFGAPIALAAATTAMVEIGAATLKIASKRRALSEFRKYDPVSYLIAARDLPKT